MAGKKKKILLMSDDLRMFSGIATQSKEFVLGTIHHYDWVQIAGAINHPESGNILDMGEAIKNEHGIKNAYLKLYPVNGYGSADLLREIISIEKPDAILHFTDPRFWIWMYQMEHEIRQISQFFIIIYGMIYQILYGIKIIIEVVIYLCQYQNKLMD